MGLKVFAFLLQGWEGVWVPYLSPLKSWMCSPCARELLGLSQTQLQLKMDFPQGHVVIDQRGIASKG